MKPQHNIVMVLVTVVVLGGVGFGLYFLLRTFGFLVGGFDSEVSRMALVGYITLTLSAMIIARGLSRRPALSNSGQAAKEALYERVLAAWSEAHRRGGMPSGAEVDELERLLVLRASKSVLNYYLGLRRLEPPFDPSDATTRNALQRLIAEIRKDLSHQDLPWSSAAAADLLFLRGKSSGGGTPGSREFKVVKE